MVQGMIYIHQLNIVHRDLKSSNVFIRVKKEGNKPIRYEAMIADFGISVFTHEFAVEKADQKNLIQGFSVRYAAPEVG